MNVSLAMLRKQLYSMRSWDSSGKTQDGRIKDALNSALMRMSSDVPNALIPDEEHVVLYPDVIGTDASVSAKVVSHASDKRLLKFVDTAGVNLTASSSVTTWRPTVTGEWDMIMHIEVTDSAGRIHRRQCIEWWTVDETVVYDTGQVTETAYVVTLDRPFNELIAVKSNSGALTALDFRIHQPEFFVDADVMEILEPARIFDGTRQQVWKIDTAGARRQDMLDFEGSSKGRPYRCWRGRHFQLPAPTEPPKIREASAADTEQTTIELSVDDNGLVIETETTEIIPGSLKGTRYAWADAEGLRRGRWAVCYTYVMGRKDEEWQLAPSVTPGGDTEQDSSYGLTWSYRKGSVLTGENQYSGIHDPQFESAPSPVKIINQTKDGDPSALVISATQIDAMQGFGDIAFARYGRSGVRIRYYVAHLRTDSRGSGTFNDVETNERFHLLCEVEPTFDMVTKLEAAGTAIPEGITRTGEADSTAARIVWSGAELYDYHRPLRHSTGYYAWKVFPHQDDRYELDFRVSRMPMKYGHDQDTAAIHPEAIPTLIELALYYVSLVDGNDQISAQAHLDRYLQLVRVFRDRYGNPGGIVEPKSILGYSGKHRYGKHGSTPLDD